jgi:hypothetical protein
MSDLKFHRSARSEPSCSYWGFETKISCHQIQNNRRNKKEWRDCDCTEGWSRLAGKLPRTRQPWQVIFPEFRFLSECYVYQFTIGRAIYANVWHKGLNTKPDRTFFFLLRRPSMHSNQAPIGRHVERGSGGLAPRKFRTQINLRVRHPDHFEFKFSSWLLLVAKFRLTIIGVAYVIWVQENKFEHCVPLLSIFQQSYRTKPNYFRHNSFILNPM